MKQGPTLADARKMVKWFSPRLLIYALFQTIVAGLFGRYADQRTIQQLEDGVADDPEEIRRFVGRYDYSGEAVSGEPFWADFVADLGDGFDSTYSVAYMLAAEALRGQGSSGTPHIAGVRNLARNEVLPHGKILIMGGDQVYPWPSAENYRTRLQLPYALALPPLPPASDRTDSTPAAGSPTHSFYGAEQPRFTDGPLSAGGKFREGERHVFAIPGNHDWYDGLSSFDAIFCGARAQRSLDETSGLGRWSTQQHRSYFAIKLPYNWWIWGADIQLSEHLDSGQINYFRSVARHMGPEDKFVLVTAQPSWLQFGTTRETQTRSNLRNLIDMPLQRGAKICGIISGDTHHYSRYSETDVLGNFNLIVAGGGGAYCHGTRHLQDEVRFDWVDREVSFRLDRKLAPKPDSDGETTRSEPTTERAAYPSRAQSLRLAIGNVLPGRNWSFALAMGIIYWLLSWSISEMYVQPPEPPVAAAPQSAERSLARSRSITAQRYWIDEQSATNLREKVERRQNFEPQQNPYWRSIAPPSTTAPSPRAAEGAGETPLMLPVRHWMLAEVRQFNKRIKENELSPLQWRWWHELRPTIANSTYMMSSGLVSSPAASIFVAAIFFAFILISETRRRGWAGRISRFISGSLHFLAHLVAMWFLFSIFTSMNRTYREHWEAQCIDGLSDGFFIKSFCKVADDSSILGIRTDVWERLALPIEMVFVGAIVASVIFGIYLFLSHLIFGTKSDWAFSARSSPKYRNFLRMKFEPNRMTIYPIGLDSPPQLRQRWAMPGWRESRAKTPGAPRVDPHFALKPHLIEGPIVIDANTVKNIPRRPG